jgi:hypothetical protein
MNKKIICIFVSFLISIQSAQAYIWLIAENIDIFSTDIWNDLIVNINGKVWVTGIEWWEWITVTQNEWKLIITGDALPIVPPHIGTGNVVNYLQPEQRWTFTFTWSSFTPGSTLIIAWFDWTIHSFWPMDEEHFSIDMTPGTTERVYDISVQNTIWVNTGSGIGLLHVIDQILIVWNDTTWRKWADGTYARTCDEYRNPNVPNSYNWDTWDWIYIIRRSWWSLQRVYCDMTTRWWGWMFFWHYDNRARWYNFFKNWIGTYSENRTDGNVTYSLWTDTFSHTEMMWLLDSNNPLTADSTNKIVFYKYAQWHVAFNNWPITCTWLSNFEYAVSISWSYFWLWVTNACDTIRWYTRTVNNAQYLTLFYYSTLWNYWWAGMWWNNSWYHDWYWFIR